MQNLNRRLEKLEAETYEKRAKLTEAVAAYKKVLVEFLEKEGITLSDAEMKAELKDYAQWLNTTPLSYLDYTMAETEAAEVILDWCIDSCRKEGGAERDVRKLLKAFAADESLGVLRAAARNR